MGKKKQPEFNFVPPTTPEAEDEFAHLRPEIEPGDVMYDMDPFELFGEIGIELATEEDITAEELVFSIQALSGRILGTQRMRNMLGWAQEAITRNQHAETWHDMTKAERTKILYGVDIDFGEPTREERIAV